MKPWNFPVKNLRIEIGKKQGFEMALELACDLTFVFT